MHVLQLVGEGLLEVPVCCQWVICLGHLQFVWKKLICLQTLVIYSLSCSKIRKTENIYIQNKSFAYCNDLFQKARL